MAVNGIPLIKDRFEAWIHGPVSPALYSEYRDYKWSTIPRRKKDVEEISNDDIKRFLNIIWDMYGGNTADELEEMTHAEQPWKNARGNIESWKPSDRVISHDDMKTYYSNLLNDD